VRSDVKVKSGKWYFEVTLISGSAVSIGLCTDRCVLKGAMLGQDSESFGWNVQSRQTLHATKSTAYGDNCYSNDIVSVLLDCDARTVTYFRNGDEIGTAFNNVVVGDGLAPAVTLTRKQKVRINIGKSAYRYPMMFEVYPDLHSFCLKMTTEQARQLETMFEKYRGMLERRVEERWRKRKRKRIEKRIEKHLLE
jgi:hypothetical protein